MDEAVAAVISLLVACSACLTAYLVHDRNKKQVAQAEAEARKWEALKDLP